MTHATLNFYEQLADDYHLIFADWRSAVLQQSEILHRVIQQVMPRSPLTLLDCSCGIGTQAIGLAKQGYLVHATDLSPASVKRARQAAAEFNVSLTFGTADFRSLATDVAGEFDVVLTCDNALPHLLTQADLQQAISQIYIKVKPGGILLASIRDYDAVIQTKPKHIEPRMLEDAGEKRVIFQIWNWLEDENNLYQVHHFILCEKSALWQTQHRTTLYRALLRHELDQALTQAGFTDIRWSMPAESDYYQPIVTARRPLM